MENGKEYYAFISYKREDEQWAKWLQNKLEHYKLPSNLNGRTDLPKEIRPIFRDQSELAAGVLADEINKALTNSKYLIVICSPRAAQSVWVGKEVQTFIDLGRTDKIIPFIIGGTAHAQNPEDECFPLALLNLPPEQELLGINIDELGRDAAAVKVVAQMFGLNFDTLWQRYEREQKKKRNWMIIGCVVAFFVLAGIALWMYWQKQQIVKANWETMRNYAVVVSEQANSKYEEGDCYEARRLALSVLPKDLSDPDCPYTPEAEYALRKAFEYDSFVIHDEVINNSFSVYAGNTYPMLNGERVISPLCDKIGVWNAKTGAVEKWWVYSIGSDCNGDDLVFSNDSSCIFFPLYENILVLNAQSGDIVDTLKCDGAWISNLDLSKNGEQLLVVAGRTARIWDISERRLIWDLDKICWVKHAEYMPDGKSIALLEDSNNKIDIISIDTKEEIISLVHPEIVGTFCINNMTNKIITSCTDSTIRIWNPETGLIESSFSVNINGYESLCIDLKGDNLFLIDNEDIPIIKWNLITGRKEQLSISSYLKWGIDGTIYSGSRIIDTSNNYRVLSKYIDTIITSIDFNLHIDNHVRYCKENQVEIPNHIIEALPKEYHENAFIVEGISYTDDRKICIINGYYQVDDELSQNEILLLKEGKFIKVIKSRLCESYFDCRISPQGNYFIYYREDEFGEGMGWFFCDSYSGETLWHLGHEKVFSSNPNKVLYYFHNEDYVICPVMKGQFVDEFEFYLQIVHVKTGKTVYSIKLDNIIVDSIFVSYDDKYIYIKGEDGKRSMFEFPPLQELIDKAKKQIENKNNTKLEIKDFSPRDEYEFEEDYYDD